MITFIEDSQSNYQHRTIINAGAADATIAFAVLFSTPGEILTKVSTEKAGKLYIPISLELITEQKAKAISDMLVEKNCHSLNIAGNGISRLKNFSITQRICDTVVYNNLNLILNSNPNLKITSIRSGGQTGADESGIKAAELLGIDSICYCPKGWRFRTDTEEISDEIKFKARFNNGN